MGFVPSLNFLKFVERPGSDEGPWGALCQLHGIGNPRGQALEG